MESPGGATPAPGAPVSAMNFPALDEIYGVLLIGVLLNCILFGIMVMQVQAFINYQTYKADHKWIRLFVAYLFLAETANTACNMYVIYEPVIKRFGQVEVLLLFPKLLAASPVITCLISTPVQMFMAWRISVITRRRIGVALVICFFSLLSLAGGCWVTANVIILKTFAYKDTFRFNLPGVFWFVSSAISDILITVSLVFILARRSKVASSVSYTSTTADAINRIIRLTIQTGLVTMIFALLDLLLFTLSSKTAISFVFDFSVSKLYTNAVLSSLNARTGWNHLNNVDDDNILFESSKAIQHSTHRNSNTVPDAPITFSTTVLETATPKHSTGLMLADTNMLEDINTDKAAINVNTKEHLDGSTEVVQSTNEAPLV